MLQNLYFVNITFYQRVNFNVNNITNKLIITNVHIINCRSGNSIFNLVKVKEIMITIVIFSGNWITEISNLSNSLFNCSETIINIFNINSNYIKGYAFLTGVNISLNMMGVKINKVDLQK